jgi:hypothetical protein
MGKAFEQITDTMQEFIRNQHIFFVGTAPLAAEGHVNISPKGTDCFRILNENRVAYLDLTGSGNETSAHIAENQRITFMFCAFEGAPNIVRLYGTGTTILPHDSQWQELIGLFPHYPGIRQIILADIHRTSTSCGYAVPFFDYQGERDTLTRYWEVKGDQALPDYHRQKNMLSIDGIISPLGQALDEEK